MQKIILYYKFVSIKDPAIARLWQLNLCRRLNLRGRIIIAEDGLNGTLGGELGDLRSYKREMNDLPAFRDMEYKWSDGSRQDFPKLSVKVRPEIITLSPKTAFDAKNDQNGLSPQKWHQYLQDNPQTLVLDARNYYESEIGYFKTPNLLRPQIKTFKEIKQVVAKLPKDKPVLTYCTGDVRCEYLSAYMTKNLGFAKVRHLSGGIMRYGQIYGDSGFWTGKCYVFDQRMQLGFSKQAKDIAECSVCRRNSSAQVNCDDCNRQLVLCQSCQKKPHSHCRTQTVSSRKRQSTR